MGPSRSARHLDDRRCPQRAAAARARNSATGGFLTDQEYADRKRRDDETRGDVRVAAGTFVGEVGTRTHRQTSLVIEPGQRPRAGAHAGRGPAHGGAGQGRQPAAAADLGGSQPVRALHQPRPLASLPTLYGNGLRIVQGPGVVAISHEMIHETRIIPIDGRLPGRELPSYMGYSTGRWDGDTLVIETSGFTNKTALAGTRHTEKLRVVERLTRTADDTITYEATVTDPGHLDGAVEGVCSADDAARIRGVSVRMPRGQQRAAEHAERGAGRGESDRGVREEGIATSAAGTSQRRRDSSRRSVVRPPPVKQVLFVLLFSLLGCDDSRAATHPAHCSRASTISCYATPDLQLGIDAIEKQLGVKATPAVSIQDSGTRNALVALGPTSYLEIIGPDPEQPKPSGPRRFGIDDLKAPRIVRWVVKSSELPAVAEKAAQVRA